MPSSEHYRILSTKLKELAQSESLALNEEEAAQVSYFHEVGEYGLALETLLDIVVDREAPPSNLDYDRMADLVELMGLSEGGAFSRVRLKELVVRFPQRE
jgi:hypothetical protein